MGHHIWRHWIWIKWDSEGWQSFLVALLFPKWISWKSAETREESGQEGKDGRGKVVSMVWPQKGLCRECFSCLSISLSLGSPRVRPWLKDSSASSLMGGARNTRSMCSGRRLSREGGQGRVHCEPATMLAHWTLIPRGSTGNDLTSIQVGDKSWRIPSH